MTAPLMCEISAGRDVQVEIRGFAIAHPVPPGNFRAPTNFRSA